jgi:primosomal protein N' (replication factor Y)
LPPLPADWFRLTEFCADYYHVPLGQVMLSTCRPDCAPSNPSRPGRRGKRPAAAVAQPAPELTGEQQAVLTSIAELGAGFHAYLLHGVTGSGKTEVYLRLIERALADGQQSLLLVPEINLTPQLEAASQRVFPPPGWSVCTASSARPRAAATGAPP